MKRLLVLGLTLFAISATGATLPDDDATIVHVLNRIGFGPRTGDVERVKRIGLQRYIDEQLRPDRIQDAAMAPRLATLKTIGMSSREIAQEFTLSVKTIESHRQTIKHKLGLATNSQLLQYAMKWFSGGTQRS